MWRSSGVLYLPYIFRTLKRVYKPTVIVISTKLLKMSSFCRNMACGYRERATSMCGEWVSQSVSHHQRNYSVIYNQCHNGHFQEYVIYRVPTWDQNEINIRSTWDNHEINMRSTWDHHEIIMRSTWDQHEINMRSSWDHHEINMRPTWDQHEINMRSTWY